ncbi:MAG: VWA domain-containing protein [Acidobacteria bacterium]|nr:VWA domain-containing protein [Acidobacteriota bacterium]
MKVKYQKWEGFEGILIAPEELFDLLSQFFLQSGRPLHYQDFRRDPNLRYSDDLMREILRLIQEGKIPAHQVTREQVEDLLRDLQEEGYIERVEGKWELTDKGFHRISAKALRDLLQAVYKSHLGSHLTSTLGTGVEIVSASKKYEFGDHFNLNISQTFLNAIQREGPRLPLALEQGDFEVYQSEHSSSCATVLMLDCSHSMILYGEDRFTPAKKVALALSHLIRTQFPGDSLNVVLFHNSAEEVPLRILHKVKVGPYYTNTCEGLKLSRRILNRKRCDNRQVIMITDGKPSAITTDQGQVYRDAWGLNPFIVARTLDEVRRCRDAQIPVNTFMLADDHYLVEFVKEVTRVSRGKAYFTTPQTLGQYLLLDYLAKKRRKIKSGSA